MSDFTVRCNDTARQKKLQERSCEIFLIYFDSGSSLSWGENEFASSHSASSLSWGEIEFASSHSANHGQYLTRDGLVDPSPQKTKEKGYQRIFS